MILLLLTVRGGPGERAALSGTSQVSLGAKSMEGRGGEKTMRGVSQEKGARKKTKTSVERSGGNRAILGIPIRKGKLMTFDNIYHQISQRGMTFRSWWWWCELGCCFWSLCVEVHYGMVIGHSTEKKWVPTHNGANVDETCKSGGRSANAQSVIVIVHRREKSGFRRQNAQKCTPTHKRAVP